MFSRSLVYKFSRVSFKVILFAVDFLTFLNNVLVTQMDNILKFKYVSNNELHVL